MYLKRIEVKGFKSFADKIELDFESGITAVVGPNGSGKSNIADAVKWVLGEQSAKSLRGAKMEDVIFAGTEQRGALGYAEVSLIIDNEDHLIDFSYSEITVKRRLYRTGESEYSINGAQCRLKDILEVFMDTGIGKDGYSLIGQGKIDEILSTRSEDRRNIFEEAAGIVKYKWRKNEAERKLENTKQNLLRVDDIIYELEEQIEPLGNQAENAKRFLSYRDTLKSLEVNLLANNYSDIKEKLTKSQKEEEALKNTKVENENKATSLKEKNESIKVKLKSIEEESIYFNNSIIEMEKLYENKQGNLKLLNERYDNLNKEKDRINKEIEEEKSYIINLEDNIKEILNKNIEDEEILEKVKENLSYLEEKFKSIQISLQEKENLIENKKSDIIQVIKELSDISNKENVCEVNITNLNNRKSQILKDKASKEERILTLNNEKNKHLTSVEELNSIIQDVKISLNTRKSKISSYENENISLTKERNRVFDTLKQKEARFLTLSSMEKDMEGFSRAVKSVVKNYPNKGEIFGTINEIIEVPTGYETSIETALSGSVQNIVVKDEGIARGAIEYLKKNNLGRATFYPLTTIKGRYVNLKEEVKSIKGFKAVASDIVKYNPMFQNIITNLLGRVIICEDLISAREIARKTDYAFRIVTLDGDVINSGGSYTGGSSNYKNSGFISRKNTIKELEEEIKSYREKLTHSEGSIKLKEEEIKKLKVEEIAEEEKLQNLTSKWNVESINIKSIEDNLKSINVDISDLLIELEQIENEIINNNKFSKNANSERETLLEKQFLLEKDISSLTEEFKEDNRLKEELQEKITKTKIKFSEKKGYIESLKEKLDSMKNSKASHERRISMFSNQIIDMEGKSLETQEETKVTISDLQKISKKSIDIKNKVHEIDILRKEHIEKRDYIEKEISKVDETIKDIFQSIHRFEVQNSKYEIELESIASKLWENYETSIPEALNLKTPIKSVSEVEKHVKNIKDSIKALGNININAIEEYKSLVERYNFLCTQREDLLEAEKSLMKIIEEMTVKMSVQFKEKFKIMRENFNETFKQLFGGGHADLKMEGTDPLTSGIEIIVQPPGKKLQSLTLLSGGEKGLSAIALIFAILKMKPTPFCILDEIEAALDDANVNRYARFLKEYSKNTQFIIITHRKGSMAAADSLYGVTMEEKGVSKIISLKLEGGI